MFVFQSECEVQIANIGINLFPNRGGIYRTVKSFTQVFNQLAWDASVLNFGASIEGPTAFACPSTFIQTLRWPKLRQYYVGLGYYKPEIRKVLSSADVVFIHGIFHHAAAVVSAYCRARNVPYILVSHGSLDPYVFTYNSIRKRVWTTTYRKRLFVDSAAVLFSTQAEAEKAKRWTNGGNVEVLYWPVDLVPEYDKSDAKAELRRRYELPPKTRIALFCGRLDPMKRPIETIREFKAAAGKEWALLLVGPLSHGLSRETVDSACREPGAKCIWVGPAYGEDLGDHFRAADLFILWSHRENFSHVVAEALACAVPVFISRGVDLWRDLAPVGCSFLAPEGAEGSVSGALSRVLCMSEEDLGAAGRRGRVWARDELSVERFGRRVERICESVSSGRKREPVSLP